MKTRFGKMLAAGAMTLGVMFLAGCGDDNMLAEEVLEAEQIEAFADHTELTEMAVMQYFHEITHGFVRANKKWGTHRQLNENVIVNLRNIIEAEGKDFENYDFFMKTLDEWEHDYENMVDVHNHIWEQQGGTTGRAYDLMNEDEIKRYYRDSFGIKEDYYLLDNGRGLYQGDKYKDVREE